MQTRPFSQCGAVVVVPEMLLHLIPAYLDAMRAGSLEQQGLSLHPGLQIHSEPVVERDGTSRRRRLGRVVVQGAAWVRGRGERGAQDHEHEQGVCCVEGFSMLLCPWFVSIQWPTGFSPVAAGKGSDACRKTVLFAQLAAEVVQRSLESCKRQINSYSRINSQITRSGFDSCVRCAIVAMAQRLDGVCNSMCRFVLHAVVLGLNSGYIVPGVRDWAPSA